MRKANIKLASNTDVNQIFILKQNAIMRKVDVKLASNTDVDPIFILNQNAINHSLSQHQIGVKY